MNRDLKIYFLVIGLPALLLALGGLRLLGLESQRTWMLARSALRSKSVMVAHELRGKVREKGLARKDLRERLPELLKEIDLGEDENDEESAMIAELHDMRAERGEQRERGERRRRDAAGTGSRRFPFQHAQQWLAPEAPGWVLVMRWRNGNRMIEQASRRVWMIGASVLLLLVMTLLAGGWLLMRSARQARLAARRETDFTAGVSHELKTPLTELRLAAEFAESRTPDGEVKTALGDVIAATERLTRMVSDVLDLGRLSDGRRLELEEMDVGDGLRVMANREAYDHIMGNLRDNAAKYAAGTPCEVAVRDLGRTVAVDVMDRGPGVPPEWRERVFERYRRGQDAAERGLPGCGLGLAIARMLARAMGGDLVCGAREGGGAVFTLTLGKACDG